MSPLRAQRLVDVHLLVLDVEAELLGERRGHDDQRQAVAGTRGKGLRRVARPLGVVLELELALAVEGVVERPLPALDPWPRRRSPTRGNARISSLTANTSATLAGSEGGANRWSASRPASCCATGAVGVAAHPASNSASKNPRPRFIACPRFFGPDIRCIVDANALSPARRAAKRTLGAQAGGCPAGSRAGAEGNPGDRTTASARAEMDRGQSAGRTNATGTPKGPRIELPESRCADLLRAGRLGDVAAQLVALRVLHVAADQDVRRQHLLAVVRLVPVVGSGRRRCRRG